MALRPLNSNRHAVSYRRTGAFGFKPEIARATLETQLGHYFATADTKWHDE